MDFAQQVKKSTEKVKSQINDSLVSMAKELFEEVVDKTPVLTGRLINNWYTAYGSISLEANPNSYSSTGVDSLARIAAISNSKEFYGKDGSISLSNSVTDAGDALGTQVFYAQAIEHYGWSKKQPAGMARVSLSKIAAKYKFI